MVAVIVAMSTEILTLGVSGACTRVPTVECVGEVVDSVELLPLCRRARPRVVISNTQFLEPDGVVAITALSELSTKVLLVGPVDRLDDAAPLLRAGAAGYVCDSIGPSALGDAIHAAASGALVLEPALTRRLLTAHERERSAPVLSPRERQILALVANGGSHREIGEALYLSETTVKTHLVRASVKLGVRGRAAASAAALRLGLV